MKLIITLLILTMIPVNGYSVGSMDFESSVPNSIDLGTSTTLVPTRDITVCAWTNKESSSSSGIIIARMDTGASRPWMLRGQASVKKVRMCVWTSSEVCATSANNAYPDSTWVFVCGRYDGSNVEALIDNSVVASASQTGNLNSTTHSTLFGTASDGSSLPFDGLISNARVWDRVLDDTELETARRCRNQPQRGLIGHWQLYDNTALDISGNGNNGSCVSCPSNSADGPPTAWCVE